MAEGADEFGQGLFAEGLGVGALVAVTGCRGGASVKQVQLVLGHASAVITLRIYAHLWPGEEDRTRTDMDAVLGGLRTGCGKEDHATQEGLRSSGMTKGQAFLVS